MNSLVGSVATFAGGTWGGLRYAVSAPAAASVALARGLHEWLTVRLIPYGRRRGLTPAPRGTPNCPGSARELAGTRLRLRVCCHGGVSREMASAKLLADAADDCDSKPEE